MIFFISPVFHRNGKKLFWKWLKNNFLRFKKKIKICCDKCTEFLIYFFRSMTDRKFAFEALREAGAYLTTSERIILGLAPDAAHPKFRQLQKLVMDSAADTGLVQ